ncbi:MAG: sigma-70 family RNA polymerase sigma factor [Chloroflexi bacterium]|nr:sigma-70 family RNA polymerase sigma factor [Chloroflexota bacterium]
MQANYRSPYLNDKQAYNLFVRAIENRDDEAWTAVHTHYHKLVLSWINTRVPKSLPTEMNEDLVQDTFFRFWRALVNKTGYLKDRFPHVGALLKYLKSCAISACYDWYRQLSRQRQLQQRLIQELNVSNKSSNQFQKVEQDWHRQRIWQWIHGHIKDKDERLVVNLSYEIGLKPAMIARQYPQCFDSVADVQRIKDRVIKRAQRALGATPY